MSLKLLPCPFCGLKSIYRKGGDFYQPHGWTAGCPDGHAISPDHNTKREAADWWNRRSPSPQKREEPQPTTKGRE